MSLYSLNDVLSALKPIASIPCPPGDNDGDPINADTVLPYLSPLHQQQVQYAVELLHDYTRLSDGTPNRRAVNALTRNGYPATLHEDQYDIDRFVGRVVAGEWDIDISDPHTGNYSY